jgi:response regulator RpfG family c-di-GMP phosphodiesterase
MTPKSEKKINVLFAEDEGDLREVVTFYIESHFPAVVTDVKSGNEAIEKLKEHQYDLILSDYHMKNGSGGDLFKYLVSTGQKIPFVLFSGGGNIKSYPEFKDHPVFEFIEKPAFVEPIKNIFQRHLSGEAQDEIRLSPPSNFVRIKARNLLLLHSLPCDVYLKLTDAKYVKVLNLGDHFDVEQFNRFREKTVQYLYLLYEDSAKFLDVFSKEILMFLEAKGDEAEEHLFETSANIQNVVSEMANAMGFTPEVRELAMTNTNLALNFLQRHKKLNQLLQHIKVDSEGYLYQHSVALAYLSSGLALQMGWDSEATLFKLSLAAFLHDITLTNAALAHVRSLQDVDLSEADREIVRMHPQKAAAIAAGFTDVPPDVDTIVAQHHEAADGHGFPFGLSHTRIAPLACLFIISQDIIDYFHEKGTPINLAEFVKTHEGIYMQGYFKKVYMNLALNSAA